MPEAAQVEAAESAREPGEHHPAGSEYRPHAVPTALLCSSLQTFGIIPRGRHHCAHLTEQETGNGGSESLSHLPKVTQQVTGGTGI